MHPLSARKMDAGNEGEQLKTKQLNKDQEKDRFKKERRTKIEGKLSKDRRDSKAAGEDTALFYLGMRKLGQLKKFTFLNRRRHNINNKKERI